MSINVVKVFFVSLCVECENDAQGCTSYQHLQCFNTENDGLTFTFLKSKPASVFVS